jgi:hypothetical protein
MTRLLIFLELLFDFLSKKVNILTNYFYFYIKSQLKNKLTKYLRLLFSPLILLRITFYFIFFKKN